MTTLQQDLNLTTPDTSEGHIQESDEWLLVKLLPEDISKQWDILSAAIESSLPPSITGGQKTMINIFESLLTGQMQGWLGCRYTTEGLVPYGILVTEVIRDVGSKQRQLLLYSIYGYKTIPAELWKVGLEALKNFARGTGCSKIVGYTDVQRIIDVVDSLGGNTKWTFLQLEV